MLESSLVASGCYSLIVVYGLWSTGSVVVSKGFSCPRACGIFLDQYLNPSLAIGKWILNHWARNEVQYWVLSQLFHSPPSPSARVIPSGLFMIWTCANLKSLPCVSKRHSGLTLGPLLFRTLRNNTTRSVALTSPCQSVTWINEIPVQPTHWVESPSF